MAIDAYSVPSPNHPQSVKLTSDAENRLVDVT